MKNWRGTGGVSSLPSNLSAFAPPFTVPRAVPYPNSSSYCDSAEGLSVVTPVNWERDSWDHLSSGDASANRYLSSSHEVDPNVPYANYYSFSDAEISSDGNTQMPSWDLPVGVASTDCTVSHTQTAGNLGKDVEAGLSYSSYSSFGVTGNDSLLAANHSSFVGSSAPKPNDGKLDKLSSDHHMIGSSSIADAWDDRLDGSAVRYPLKRAQIDGKCRLEEEKSAQEHVTKTYNAQDVWSNARSGPEIKYPLESAWVDGNNWLAEGKPVAQHLAGTSNGDVVQSNGWDGPAVEYPFKSAQVVGKESCHQAPHPELGSDIWKQQTRHAPLWEQSTWWHGPNTDYESLVVKSPSAPAARLRANASSITTGLVTQSKCNNEIDGDNENFVDMIPFHSMESYPLLGTGNELQFDATCPRIKPDTNAFESQDMAKDGGLPKEKFSPKNSFDHMPQSSSSSRFSSLYLGNSAMAASTHPACDVAGSDSWGFPSDQATSSHFFDKGLVKVKSVDQPLWDSLYTQDIPIHHATGALFWETEIANTNQAATVEGSGSFLKPPSVSYTSDGEQRFDGTVEAGSSWIKEIQSAHGTYRTAATEHDDLPVSSCNLGFNSCFPLQQKLNEGEKTPYKMHPCGDHVTTSEKGVQSLSDGSAGATSVLVEEISGSSAPSNLSGQEKGESEPKVDLRMMVLTLHNLSGLLHSYCSSGKCEVREEDHHLLEKAIHNLAACSTKDVMFLPAEEEELKISEEELCLEDSTKPCAGQVDDPPNGQKKQVNSLCNSEEKSSLEMLSSGEDLATVKDNDSTQVDDQILYAGKQQRTDEGKLCSETFSSGVNSHVVKEDNVIQPMKEILSQHYHDGHESDPQVNLFRNLWLEAEAELCSLNCKSRFDRLKSKLDASGIKVSSEIASAVETPLRPAASTNFVAGDYFSSTRSLEKNQKLVDSPRSCSNAKAGGGSDVMARFVIPDSHHHDLDLRNDSKQEQKIHVEVPQLQTAKDAGADFLTERAGLSPPILFSSVVKGTTCSGENIEDAVMSRFNILLQRDENLSSKQNDLVNTEAIESKFEQNICHRDVPDRNKAAELESDLSEDMGSPSQCISESFVMSRLNVIKQRDENAGFVEKIVCRETVEVEPGEKPVDGHGAGEIGYPSPNVAHYHDRLSSSRSGECMKDSVLNRLKIIKLRHEKQNSAENLVFRESVDLGSTIRGDYLSGFEERSIEGSKAKAEHVLLTKTFLRADDAAKMNSEVRFYNLKSNPVNILSGGSFDAASSDWEHVLKEEVAGGTSEQ